MLKLRNLNLYIEDKQLFENLNLDVNKGEIHVLMGKNGVGKSSIAKALMGDTNYKVEGNIYFNDEDIILIWEKILNTGLINCKVDPSDINLGNTTFTELSLDDKKRFLMEILDKNQLYVNYCDMEDATFAISEEDKTFTYSFYEEM